MPVDLKQCGKWVVAQDNVEEEYLHNLELNAMELDVPVHFVPTNKAKQQYPLIRANKAILESPTSGIISAHEFVSFHEANFENSEGTIGLNSRVVGISHNPGTSNYTITVDVDGEVMEITSDNVVNSAGLFAADIANMVLPQQRHYNYYYAKGNYFSYTPETPIGQKNYR